MNPRQRTFAAAICTALALSLSACGSGSGSTPPDSSRDGAGDVSTTPSAQVTGTPASNAKIIKITLNGKTVDPSALRVKIALKQPVVLQVHASQAGQLHVHSSPEQTIDFAKGDSEITLSFDVPGIVDVEDHALDALIAQLEVS